MEFRAAREAACRQHLLGGRRRAISRTAGVAAVLLVGLTACADQSESTPEETPAPPLDEPTEETAQGQGDESESQPANEESDDTAEHSEDGDAQQENDSEVLDASEFSSEAQESTGFPDMVTELPEGSDELLLTEVRAGKHEGYDRIVFEHTGEGAPGWYAEYVDEAVEPGSGFPVEIEGEAILYLSAVGLSPGNVGSDQGQLELSTLADSKGTVFEDAVTTFVHHGTASYYVGLDQERDFRVSVWEHENGPRLIIDVLR